MAYGITDYTNSAIDNYKSERAPPKPRFAVAFLADGMAGDTEAEPHKE